MKKNIFASIALGAACTFTMLGTAPMTATAKSGHAAYYYTYYTDHTMTTAVGWSRELCDGSYIGGGMITEYSEGVFYEWCPNDLPGG